MNTRKTILCILLSIMAVVAMRAQVRFTVEAPATTDINSEIRIVYKIQGAVATNFEAPSFSDFEVLSGPAVSQFSSMSSVGGRTVQASQSTTWTYILFPKRKGSFKLSPASVRVGSKTYRTRSVTIKVDGSGKKQPYPSKGSSSAAGEEDLQPAGSRVTQKDLFLTVTTNKTTVYEQEPVVLTYRIHWKNGVGLSGVTLRRKPALEPFLAQEVSLPGNLSPVVERRNGTLCRSAVNLQYVLFPQKVGTLTIPSALFEATVIQRDLYGGDPVLTFFNGGGNLSVKVNRTTPDLPLKVLPLPSPRPAGFSGGVGRLQMSGELLTPQLKTNELCTYRITITGAGNMKMLEAPTVTFPKDFDVYGPKTTDETELTAEGVAGKLIFDYTFVPQNVGRYTIPAVRLVYFDTEQRAYRTLTTASRTVDIAQGKRSSADARRAIELARSDIRDIVGGPVTFRSADAYYIFGTPTHVMLLAGVVVLFVATVWMLRFLRRRRVDGAAMRLRRAARSCSRRLRQASQLLEKGEIEPFYAALSGAMYDYAVDRFALLPSSSKEAIRTSMLSCGVSDSSINSFMTVIDECEYARFAPEGGGVEGAKRLQHEAEAVLSSIEAALKSNHISHRSMKKKGVFLFFLVFCLPVVGAPSKEAADSAYNARNYAEAVHLYESVLTQGISAPVYYNLGNAYYRLKDYPRAVLNYRRALRYEPSMEAARYNLVLCESKLPDRFERAPQTPFSSFLYEIRSALSADDWAFVGLVSFVLALALSLLWLFGGRLWLRKTAFVVALLLFSITVAVHIFAYKQYDDCFHLKQAVLMAPVTLRGGPDAASPVSRELHAGTTVVVRATLGAHVRVELPDGTAGWIVDDHMVYV